MTGNWFKAQSIRNRLKKAQTAIDAGRHAAIEELAAWTRNNATPEEIEAIHRALQHSFGMETEPPWTAADDTTTEAVWSRAPVDLTARLR